MKPYLIFFDGHCALCHGFLNFSIKRDKNKSLLFSPLDSELAKEFLTEAPQVDSVIVFDDGKILSKSDAVISVLKRLKSPWPTFAQVLQVVPQFIRDFGYSVIASIRYKIFGRYERCPITPGGSNPRVVFTAAEYNGVAD